MVDKVFFFFFSYFIIRFPHRMPWYFNIEFNNIQSVNRLWYLKLKRMWYNLPFIFNLARLCIRQGRQGVGPKSQGWIYMDPQDQVQQWPDEQGVVPHGPRSQRPSQDPKDFRLGPIRFSARSRTTKPRRETQVPRQSKDREVWVKTHCYTGKTSITESMHYGSTPKSRVLHNITRQ